MWLHNVADLLIWLSYMAIPVLLISFVRRRRDMPFTFIYWLFGAFILGCGFTHLMEVVVSYTPLYRLSGLVKVITALASMATVAALVPLLPKALAMPSPEALAHQIEERKRAEADLRQLHAELESRVQNRTTELLQVNEALHKEISHREQVESQLREAQQRKDDFLAILAHELRNPLAPIRNAMQIVRMRGPERRQVVREAWEIMDRQVGHLVRLVDDLLDVSRIGRGKINLQKRPLDFAAVVAGAIESSRPLIQARKHELLVSLPHTPVLVEGDSTRLAQVLTNLLNNAAKYTPEEGTIALLVQRVENDVVVHVRDNGSGIAADMLPKVFNLFTQAESTLDRSQGGLGIGLTLARQLVEMHGGTIQAFSDGPGHGSEFVVRLPALAEAPLRSREHTAPPAAPPTPGLRILVVDDQQDFRDSMAQLLTIWGHDVRTAGTAAAALDMATSFRPDVALLDIELPGTNGYDLAKQLRALPATARIALIASTGFNTEHTQGQVREAGFDHFLPKPADPASLQKLLQETLQRLRAASP